LAVRREKLKKGPHHRMVRPLVVHAVNKTVFRRSAFVLPPLLEFREELNQLA
jgi:hypothetical protein